MPFSSMSHASPALALDPHGDQPTAAAKGRVSSRWIVAVLTAMSGIAPGIGLQAQTAPLGVSPACDLEICSDTGACVRRRTVSSLCNLRQSWRRDLCSAEWTSHRFLRS